MAGKQKQKSVHHKAKTSKKNMNLNRSASKAGLHVRGHGAASVDYTVSRNHRGNTRDRRTAEEVKDLAKFPEENPFPVLRISSQGKILYSNNPGLVLMERWGRQVGQKAPGEWCKIIAKAIRTERLHAKEVHCGERIFSIAIAPVAKSKYVNLYGRDITKQQEYEKQLRESRDQLDAQVKQRTKELAQTVDSLEKEAQERISTEQQLRERTRVLDAFFANSITPLVILDKDFNFIRVNKAYADGCQRDISEFAGHNHFEFYPHEENKRIFEDVVRTKAAYQVHAKPFNFPDHPEWGVTYWDWTLVPILDDAGKVELLVFSLKDVTDRKKSELSLIESEEQYRNLVELSPEGICTAIDEKVAFVNTAAVGLLKAKTADQLIGKSIWDFIHPDSVELIGKDIRDMLDNERKVPPREIKLIRLDGSSLAVKASATVAVHQGKAGLLVIFHDITKRKLEQTRTSATNRLLELFVQKTSRKHYLVSAVEVIRDWSGCRCVGVRLMNTDGFIPYEASVGFSKRFRSLESMLCLQKDSCACVRVINQTLEPQDAPVMTSKGSFRCENTRGFIDSLTETEKLRYRGTCVKNGFRSVAVIPILYRKEVLGAIHLADKQDNKVPLEKVQFLESMAMLIGEAVHRFDVEQSLRSSQSRLVEAQRIASLGNWDWDIANDKLWWSDEIYRIFGTKPDEFAATYEAFLNFVHPEDRELLKQAVVEALNQNKPYSIDHRIVKPGGQERIVHEQAEVSYDKKGKPLRMIGTVQDVTEQKRAEEELRYTKDGLRLLTVEMQLAEERQRRQLASDLHDSVGQILSFSSRELRALQKGLSNDTLEQSLQEVTDQLDQAVHITRTLSFDLSPSILYDLGLEVAVEDLVERFSKEKGIDCRCKNVQDKKPLAEATKVLLYRAIRELLMNIAKHARAKKVEVSLGKLDSEIIVTVKDDGQGFDVSRLQYSSGRRSGFGIFSIRERLDHIGGRLEIKSTKGKGTKVLMTAPLDV